MRQVAVVGWLLIVCLMFVWQGVGLARGPEWPVMSDFLRAFMRPAIGRFFLFGAWLWIGWHLFVRDWQLLR